MKRACTLLLALFLFSCAPVHQQAVPVKPIEAADLKGDWLWAETSKYAFAILDLRPGGAFRFYVGVSKGKSITMIDASITAISIQGNAITIALLSSEENEAFTIAGTYEPATESLRLDLVPGEDKYVFIRPDKGLWPCNSEE